MSASHIEVRLVVTEYLKGGGMIERRRIAVDPACVTINASRGGPVSATIAHRQHECRCGDMQALTGPSR